MNMKGRFFGDRTKLARDALAKFVADTIADERQSSQLREIAIGRGELWLGHLRRRSIPDEAKLRPQPADIEQLRYEFWMAIHGYGIARSVELDATTPGAVLEYGESVARALRAVLEILSTPIDVSLIVPAEDRTGKRRRAARLAILFSEKRGSTAPTRLSVDWILGELSDLRASVDELADESAAKRGSKPRLLSSWEKKIEALTAVLIELDVSSKLANAQRWLMHCLDTAVAAAIADKNQANRWFTLRHHITKLLRTVLLFRGRVEATVVKVYRSPRKRGRPHAAGIDTYARTLLRDMNYNLGHYGTGLADDLLFLRLAITAERHGIFTSARHDGGEPAAIAQSIEIALTEELKRYPGVRPKFTDARSIQFQLAQAKVAIKSHSSKARAAF